MTLKGVKEVKCMTTYNPLQIERNDIDMDVKIFS